MIMIPVEIQNLQAVSMATALDDAVLFSGVTTWRVGHLHLWTCKSMIRVLVLTHLDGFSTLSLPWRRLHEWLPHNLRGHQSPAALATPRSRFRLARTGGITEFFWVYAEDIYLSSTISWGYLGGKMDHDVDSCLDHGDLASDAGLYKHWHCLAV